MASSSAVIALCAALAACAAARGPPAVEFFDERTGATVTIVHEALTFALERSTLAAHARDYVSLTALEVDRSGEPQLYLIGYFWSTIDRRTHTNMPDHADKSLILFADGRFIRLAPVASLPRDLEANKRLLAPQTAKFEQAAYQVPLEVLRYIANSRTVSLRLGKNTDDEDEDPETYEIWGDSREALKSFIANVGPG